LNAVFSKLGDDMASAAVPQLAKLQQVGEGALETLARVVNEYIVVDDAMKSMGKTFGAVGIDSIAARDALVQISGGLDQFTSQAQFFVDNFISSAAALVPIQSAVSDEMNRLGVAGTVTKDQFASLVQSIDVSTDSGQALYAALMNVAPAFAKVADAAAALDSQRLGLQITLLQDQGNAIEATALKREQELAALDASLRPLQQAIYAQEDLNTAQAAAAQAQADYEAAATKAQNDFNAAVTKAQTAVDAAQKSLDSLTDTSVNLSQVLSSAHTDLTNAYNAQATALGNVISQMGGFSSSLTSFLGTLNSSTGDSNPLAAYSIAKSNFQSTARLAKTGDVTALGNLQSVSTEFLNASKLPL
jgi:hypothetical protein